MRLIVATKNNDKIREIREILREIDVPLLCLNDLRRKFNVTENGRTFAENAFKKALPVSRFHKNDLILGEDSGLEVEYLNGAPGIYSKRYSGKNSTYKSNNKKLLKALNGVPSGKRKANFRCCLILAKDGRRLKEFNGILSGTVAAKEAGDNGFGYDPVLYLPGYKKTVAQISPALKNKISHRGKAFRKLKRYLLKKSGK